MSNNLVVINRVYNEVASKITPTYLNTPPIINTSVLPYATLIVDDDGQNPGWADHWAVADFRVVVTGDFNLGTAPIMSKLQEIYDHLHTMNLSITGYRGMIQMLQGPRIYPNTSNLLTRGYIMGRTTGNFR